MMRRSFVVLMLKRIFDCNGTGAFAGFSAVYADTSHVGCGRPLGVECLKSRCARALHYKEPEQRNIKRPTCHNEPLYCACVYTSLSGSKHRD